MSKTVTFPVRVRHMSRLIFDGQCSKGIHYGGAAGVATRTISGATGTDSIIYGDNHRGWKTRIRKGQNATTDLTVNLRRVEKYVPCNFEFSPRCHSGVVNCVPISTGTSGYKVTGDLTNVGYPSSNVSNLDIEEATNLALTRLYQSIDRNQRQFQGGVFIGELRKTLRMIRSPAKTMFESLGSYHKYVKKRIKRIPMKHRREFLSNTYLESVYGWAPLMSDVKSGAEALAEMALREGPNTRWVNGDSRDIRVLLDDTGYVGSSLVSGSSWIAVNRRTVETSHVQVKFYGKLRVEPFERLYMRSELLGFNLSSWLPTVWELTPYSFLVDYFTNIGDVINAWTTNTSNLYWVSRTVSRKLMNTQSIRMHRTWVNTQEGAKCSGGLMVPPVRDGLLALSKMQIVRTADVLTLVKNSMPSFTFRVPGVGSMKWLNIAALAAAKSKVPLFRVEGS